MLYLLLIIYRIRQIESQIELKKKRVVTLKTLLISIIARNKIRSVGTKAVGLAVLISHIQACIDRESPYCQAFGW